MVIESKCPRHNYPVGITNNCKLCMEEYDKWLKEYRLHCDHRWNKTLTTIEICDICFEER